MIKEYHYIGPIKKFNKTVESRWEGTTKAESLAKAISNLTSQAKKYLGLVQGTAVTIDKDEVFCVTDCYEEYDNKQKERDEEVSRKYEADYRIYDDGDRSQYYFRKEVRRILKYPYVLNDEFTQEELKDLLTDVIDAREGVEDGSSFAEDLDELYALLDAKINTIDNGDDEALYRLEFWYNIYYDNKHRTYGEEVANVTKLAKDCGCKVVKWEKITKGPDNIKVTFEGTKDSLMELFMELGMTEDEWEDYMSQNLITRITDSQFNDEDSRVRELKYIIKRLESADLTDAQRDALEEKRDILREKLDNAGVKYTIDDSQFNDVKPNKGEAKQDFIARFMKETKDEYPEFKQRLAVAYSYWDKYKKEK